MFRAGRESARIRPVTSDQNALKRDVDVKISTKGRYGLRTLMDIALHQEAGAVTLNEIAGRQDISVKYLWQVINPLKTAGLLRVTRGAKGGYMLARPPSQITVLDVVRILEGSVALLDCLTDKKRCDQMDTCVARTVWMEAQKALEDALRAMTLETVLRRCAEAPTVNNYSI